MKSKLAHSFSQHAHKLLCKNQTAWRRTPNGWCHETAHESKKIGAIILDEAYRHDENVEFKECHWTANID